MKSIYGMSQLELRENLIDALVRWQEAEQASAYYQKKAEKLQEELAAQLARQAAEAAETANDG